MPEGGRFLAKKLAGESVRSLGTDDSQIRTSICGHKAAAIVTFQVPGIFTEERSWYVNIGSRFGDRISPTDWAAAPMGTANRQATINVVRISIFFAVQ
jgi:hypothetical protein